MKRWDNPLPDVPMMEDPKGRYVRFEDVEREMIPRPDAEVARKAVEECAEIIMWHFSTKAYPDASVKQALWGLLKLMGVK